MSYALNFAKTVNDLDDRLPKGRGDCFDFGSWYGCQPHCPQYMRGECEIQEENKKLFNELEKSNKNEE